MFFSNHYTMLQNHTWVKDAFKGQDRPMDFGVTQNKVYCN